MTADTRLANARRRLSFLRIAIALQTLTIFFQAVSAGLLLTASYGETLHSVGARVMYGASMLYVLAAVLAWKPGGGPSRPVWHASGFLVLASVQVVLGIAHVPSVHLPLGVLMFGLSVLALARR
ncbi:membrane protein [Streptomyces sp. e14]|nr:membrane protein [Streptomyces sp. e14]